MKSINRVFIIVYCLIFFLYSCSPISIINNQDFQASPIDIAFKVALPEPLAAEESIYIEVLDEITGINLNPKRFKMNLDNELNYSFNFPVIRGSQIKYRYIKIGADTNIELNGYGERVDYRVVLASENQENNDKIVSWEKPAELGSLSEISGYIFDSVTEAPLGEILIFFNGMRTVTSFDGYYQFKNVPTGEFNLVAIHPNGKYEAFQQKAIIAENSITPASFGMKPVKMVNITLNISVPDDTPENASIWMLGNLFSLGNSFSQENSDSGIIASRSPRLNSISNGKYQIKLQLPAGHDLRYKYSLGNHFINAEHTDSGDFVTRQLIIPNKDITISEEVESWQSNTKNRIDFRVRTPENTPENTTLSIQFNPFIWMKPIPMTEVGENEWAYTLFGPLDYLNTAQFRFCRNEQCGFADDAITKGLDAPGFLLAPDGSYPPIIDYEINDWAWLYKNPYDVLFTDFSKPQNIIIKGFALKDNYQMNWLPYTQYGIMDAAVAGANWIVLPTGWIFDNKPTQRVFVDWNRYPSGNDISSLYGKIRDTGMNLVLFPQPGEGKNQTDIWQNAELSFGWWSNWFTFYERMILNYADFAEKIGISTIIIGGGKVSPSFPDGLMPDGSPSNSPYDSEGKWLSLIEKIRTRFKGQIGFALPSSIMAEEKIGKIISQCDFVFLELNQSISNQDDPSVESLENDFDVLLDGDIYNLYAVSQKPLIINIDYYAIDGSASNCQQLGNDCRLIYQNSLSNGDISTNVVEQADIYQAALRSMIKKDWITGIISNGFNPVVSSQDASNSVRGKPAYQVIAYFFNNLNQ